MYGEVIWSSDIKIASVFNNLWNSIRGEARYQIIKRTVLKKPPFENPGGRVVGMDNRGGELLSKSCYYFSVASEWFGGKGDGLILSEGFLSRGITSGGIFVVRFFPGGFYPVTMLGMWPWEMWYFAEEFQILWNRGSPVLQEEGNSSRAKDSSASRAYKSLSVFFR